MDRPKTLAEHERAFRRFEASHTEARRRMALEQVSDYNEERARIFVALLREERSQRALNALKILADWPRSLRFVSISRIEALSTEDVSLCPTPMLTTRVAQVTFTPESFMRAAAADELSENDMSRVEETIYSLVGGPNDSGASSEKDTLGDAGYREPSPFLEDGR